MRYQIGEQIPVISFVTRNNLNGFTRRSIFFLPWEETEVSSEIVYLTVKEHHKVPGRHDPKEELLYDGFILTDDSGCVWYNQYPRADYGQLDDSSNRRFRRKDFDRHATYWDYVGLFGYLEGLLRGEHTFLQSESTADKAKILRKMYDDLVTRYETTGWKIVASPLEIEFGDGSKEVVNDHFTVKGVLPDDAPTPLKISHSLNLYPHQQKVLDILVEQGHAAINVPAGMGKGSQP